MSIAFVQGARNGGSFSSSTIACSATGTGNLIIITIGVNPTFNIVTSITDNKSNTYIQVPGAQASETGAGITDIWYCPNAIGGVTGVTVHVGTLASGFVYLMEFSGVKTTSPIDNANALSQGAGQPSTGPVLTVSNSGDLLITTINKSATIVTGITAPWVVASGTGDDNNVYLIAPGSTGNFHATYTPTSSDAYAASGVAFFPPSSGPSGAQQASTFLVF